MKMIKQMYYILAGVFFAMTPAMSQSTIDAVLQSVEKNNKSLMAAQSYFMAGKLGFKIGNTLPNPTVQYEYLIGSPAGAGNQQDFVAVKSFDFPSAYGKRQDLAREQGALSEVAYAMTRQEILLEAQLTCIELVYRNKLEIQYAQRKIALENLVQNFQKKLDTGEGNILDLNKAKLQLLELSILAKENEVAVQKLECWYEA
jgi:outer membrane protein TolC